MLNVTAPPGHIAASLRLRASAIPVAVDELREATPDCEAVVRSFTLGVSGARAYWFCDDCVGGRSLARLVNDYKKMWGR